MTVAGVVGAGRKLSAVTVGPASAHPITPDDLPQPFTFADLFAAIGGFHAA